MNLYLFITEGDVDPSIMGPFASQELRDKAAKAHKKNNGDEDGIFMLDIDENGKPTTCPYSGGFFADVHQG
jgi:hypothetical protein